MLDTTRRVATPEGIELTLRLAGPVPRALAWSVDLLLRAALVLVVVMIAGRFGRAGWGVVLIAAFFVEWLLPAWFEAMWGGQTPGKRLFRLAVLNDDGTPVRWPGALTRNLLRAADFLPFLYGVGLAHHADEPRLQAPRRPRRRHGGGVPGGEGRAPRAQSRRRRRSRRRCRSRRRSSARCSTSPSARQRLPASASRSSPSSPRRWSAARYAMPRRRACSASRITWRASMKQAPFEASHAAEWEAFEKFLDKPQQAPFDPAEMPHALPPPVPEPRARRRAALQRRPRRPAEPAGAARPPRAVRQPAARVAADPRFHDRRLSAPGARRVAPGARSDAALLRAATRA